MELVRGLHNIRDKHRGCVLTIGKFDGVHLGHQAVLKKLVSKAKDLNLPSAVMVFEPQPEELFVPDKAPARLSRLRDKYNEIEKLGVDRLLCVKFDAAFSNQTAKYFVEHLLVEKLGVAFLVVGDDFRFGKGRTGDFEMLLIAGQEFGFDVVNTDSFKLLDDRISSSAIREALDQADMDKVECMLGRSFSISGKVIHGEKKGRTIGFPTANLLLNRCKAPVSGVFAVETHVSGTHFNGVANIGHRPTVNGQRSQLEVHLFDFKGSLYGEHLDVSLLHKIRDEKKFESFEALKQQIVKDADFARNWLSNNRK